MTKEEAIQYINGLRCKEDFPYTDTIADFIKERNEAIDMAIEALQAVLNNAVSPSLVDVYKWERDIALSQLEEYGIGFAEKKRDFVEVVRCKDCKWYGHLGCAIRIVDDSDKPNDNDFCSFGERSE